MRSHRPPRTARRNRTTPRPRLDVPSRLSLRLFVAILAVAALPATSDPAGADDRVQEVPTFGATTELVYVRFHIERKGDYVGTVEADQLRILEDGKEQPIALLETPSTRVRTVPPEVTLALDVSSSVMDERLLDEELVRDVIFASLSEQARVGLCAFGGELRCLTPPTRDADAVLAGFQQALRFGVETRRTGTRLYASLADIARQAHEGEQAQRAIIVFSDGLDNQDGDVTETIRAVREKDVRIYSLTLSQAFQATSRTVPGFGQPANRTMFDYKKFELARVAEESGGRNWEPGTLDEETLARILREIGNEITMEIVVGYAPPGLPEGREHEVKVQLVDKSVGKIRGGERKVVR
jgi:VWFA-related protein